MEYPNNKLKYYTILTDVKYLTKFHIKHVKLLNFLAVKIDMPLQSFKLTVD